MLKTYEVMVKKFQIQIQMRDLELEKLTEELREATEKKQLEKTLRQRSFKGVVRYLSNSSLTLTRQFFYLPHRQAVHDTYDEDCKVDLDPAANLLN